MLLWFPSYQPPADLTPGKENCVTISHSYGNTIVSHIKQNTPMSAKHYKRPHDDIFNCIDMAQLLKRSIKTNTPSSLLSFFLFKHALWENTTFSQIKHFLMWLLPTLDKIRGKVLCNKQNCPMSPI